MRDVLLQLAHDLVRTGLNKGTAGNCSVRTDDGFLVTPSGWLTAELTEAALVPMTLAGTHPPDQRPSSEWRFHRDIYVARPEANVVIHAHPPFCTTLACASMDIPAFHYMVAVAGGTDIRCSKYATFGTQELSDHALDALVDRKACLLGHHGMLALGATVRDTLKLAIEVEELAEQYWRLRQLTPDPPLLTAAQMEAVRRKFAGYGKQG